jgi:hypothetical protein
MPGQAPHGNLGVLSSPVAKVPDSPGIYRDLWLTFRLIIGQSYRTVLGVIPFFHDSALLLLSPFPRGHHSRYGPHP